MNGNIGKTGISREAAKSAEKVMEAVRTGKIKKHLLGNTSPIRYGTMERKDMMEYQSFVKTKICYEIMQLCGEENREEWWNEHN